MSQPRFSK